MLFLLIGCGGEASSPPETDMPSSKETADDRSQELDQLQLSQEKMLAEQREINERLVREIVLLKTYVEYIHARTENALPGFLETHNEWVDRLSTRGWVHPARVHVEQFPTHDGAELRENYKTDPLLNWALEMGAIDDLDPGVPEEINSSP